MFRFYYCLSGVMFVFDRTTQMIVVHTRKDCGTQICYKGTGKMKEKNKPVNGVALKKKEISQ